MTLPDRLSIDPRSLLRRRGAGARRHPVQRPQREDVSEYCVSEGWIRVPAGKSKDRFGQPITIKLKGTVEPFNREVADRRGSPCGEPSASDEARRHVLLLGRFGHDVRHRRARPVPNALQHRLDRLVRA